MSALTTQLNKDIINIIANDIPKSCTIMSITGSAAVWQLEQSETAEVGGQLVEITTKVQAPTSVFTTAPVIGQKVTIDGVIKRIASFIKAPDDNEWIISLTDPSD